MDTLQFPIVPLDFDEVAQILDNIVDNDFPEEMYRGLTGGIYLVPEEKHNARIPSNRYYVLGEYQRNRIMGNCIFVYYGPSETIPESFQGAGNYHFTRNCRPRVAAPYGGPGRGERSGIEDEIFVQRALRRLGVRPGKG